MLGVKTTRANRTGSILERNMQDASFSHFSEDDTDTVVDISIAIVLMVRTLTTIV